MVRGECGGQPYGPVRWKLPLVPLVPLVAVGNANAGVEDVEIG